MAKIDVTQLPYRRNVGIMVLNHQGKVFIGKRLPDTEHCDDTYVWQMPQGGIDNDEDPELAARRELAEETGILSVSLLKEAPDWLYYDLPLDRIGIGLSGKYRGQMQKWFAYRFMGHEDDITLVDPSGKNSQEFTEWRWENLMRLPELIVPFKRPVYEKVVTTFLPLISS